jgi:hypothetical protein
MCFPNCSFELKFVFFSLWYGEGLGEAIHYCAQAPRLAQLLRVIISRSISLSFYHFLLISPPIPLGLCELKDEFLDLLRGRLLQRLIIVPLDQGGQVEPDVRIYHDQLVDLVREHKAQRYHAHSRLDPERRKHVLQQTQLGTPQVVATQHRTRYRKQLEKQVRRREQLANQRPLQRQDTFNQRTNMSSN